MFTNFFVSIIFLLQFSGWGFTQFDNEYGVLPSTMGNPNFLSAFLAISIAGILGWLTHPLTNSKWKPFALLQILISLWIIWKTQSIQGFAALAVGAIVLKLVYIKRFFSRLTFWFLSSIVVGIVALSVFGLFGWGLDLTNKIPQTLMFRIIYWKIGFRMIQQSPIEGLGFDSYLDNFRSYLQPRYKLILGDNVISDSPHNIYLDFFVSGGIPLGFFALLCIGLALFNGVKRMTLDNDRRNLVTNPDENLIIILIMYLAISFISPFQLSLFIWLPVIIGLTATSDRQQVLGDLKSAAKSSKKQNLNVLTVGSWLAILLSCNPITAFLPLVTEVRYRSAVESGNFYELKSVALALPYSGGRAVAIARGLLDSSFVGNNSPDAPSQQTLQLIRNTAFDVAESSVDLNPKHFESWRFLYENAPDTVTKTRALQYLQQIDPFNMDWRAK
jgi:O-Antigen ligase